jgi:hypothetical protein
MSNFKSIAYSISFNLRTYVHYKFSKANVNFNGFQFICTLLICYLWIISVTITDVYKG